LKAEACLWGNNPLAFFLMLKDTTTTTAVLLTQRMKEGTKESSIVERHAK
jgi:hypothetical protein